MLGGGRKIFNWLENISSFKESSNTCRLTTEKEKLQQRPQNDSILEKSMPDVKKKVWMSDSRLMVLLI